MTSGLHFICQKSLRKIFLPELKKKCHYHNQQPKTVMSFSFGVPRNSIEINSCSTFYLMSGNKVLLLNGISWPALYSKLLGKGKLRMACR